MDTETTGAAPIDDELRRQLALCASKKQRRVVYTPAKGPPCKWKPTTVVNPESGLPFTAVSAWQLVAKLIEGGHPIERIVLRNPKGAHGYVLKVELEAGRPLLYIKLQWGAAKVIGRSFHYSDRRVSMTESRQ